VLPSLVLAAAASTAAVSVPSAPPARALPIAARGLRCAGGGRAIGDRVGKSYIVQELELLTRDKNASVVGFIYSGADGNDYVDLSPSIAGEKTRLMGDADVDRGATMMRYCFSSPWDGVRTASGSR
jgi:hypothetical protein